MTTATSSVTTSGKFSIAKPYVRVRYLKHLVNVREDLVSVSKEENMTTLTLKASLSASRHEGHTTSCIGTKRWHWL